LAAASQVRARAGHPSFSASTEDRRASVFLLAVRAAHLTAPHRFYLPRTHFNGGGGGLGCPSPPKKKSESDSELTTSCPIAALGAIRRTPARRAGSGLPPSSPFPRKIQLLASGSRKRGVCDSSGPAPEGRTAHPYSSTTTTTGARAPFPRGCLSRLRCGPGGGCFSVTTGASPPTTTTAPLEGRNERRQGGPSFVGFSRLAPRQRERGSKGREGWL
jgi:hypothetical protein